MSKKVLMNSKTGEIIEAEELVPFASITDLKKENIKDGEDYVEGTSVTTLEGYEPLESIVARCMRTVQSPNGSTYQVLDKDALKAEETQQGLYEASGAKTLDEAFDTMDPTESQGFDLSDASIIQNRVSEELRNSQPVEASSNLSTKGTNEAPTYSEVSDVVGKSESKPETAESFPEKSSISQTGK